MRETSAAAAAAAPQRPRNGKQDERAIVSLGVRVIHRRDIRSWTVRVKVCQHADGERSYKEGNKYLCVYYCYDRRTSSQSQFYWCTRARRWTYMIWYDLKLAREDATLRSMSWQFGVGLSVIFFIYLFIYFNMAEPLWRQMISILSSVHVVMRYRRAVSHFVSLSVASIKSPLNCSYYPRRLIALSFRAVFFHFLFFLFCIYHKPYSVVNAKQRVKLRRGDHL